MGSSVSPSPCTPIPALPLPATGLTLLSPLSFRLHPLGIVQYRPQEDAGRFEHHRARQRKHTGESSSRERSQRRWLLGHPEPKPEALTKDRDPTEDSRVWNGKAWAGFLTVGPEASLSFGTCGAPCPAIISWEGSKLRRCPRRPRMCLCAHMHACVEERQEAPPCLGRETSQVKGSGSVTRYAGGRRVGLGGSGEKGRPRRGPGDGSGRRGVLGSQEEGRVCPADTG